MAQCDSLEAVARALRLPYGPDDQDWGIRRSDPRRVDEYTAFFCDRSSDLPPWVRNEVVDLVLQSANEALETGTTFDETAFTRFIDAAALTAPEQIDYWRSLPRTAGDPWPVQGWLRPES